MIIGAHKLFESLGWRRLCGKKHYLSVCFYSHGIDQVSQTKDAIKDKSENPLKPPKHGGVYVVAHRGLHTGIPENTITDNSLLHSVFKEQLVYCSCLLR